MCTRHRLHHVPHRCHPRNPVNPLIQHFVERAHWLCRGYESSPWYTLSLTHNRGIVKSCRVLNCKRLCVGVSRGFAQKCTSYLYARSDRDFVFPIYICCDRRSVFRLRHTPFSVQACAVRPLLGFSPRLFVTTHAQFVKVARASTI